MSRIDATFSALQAQGRKALIPYVTAGFPFADITPELMHAMVSAGADVIELGVPFSDPSADGPVIQKSGEKALSFGIGLRHVLGMVKTFRTADSATPVVLMGYANPIERYDLQHGQDSFIRDAGAAGVDGVLVVDYPPEECTVFAAKLRAQQMDMIFLLAPTSTEQRLCVLCFPQRGHWLRRLGHRRRASHAAAHTCPCAHSCGGGFWHSRYRNRQGDRESGRCRGDWEQNHPID